jgi:hypothetical protein
MVAVEWETPKADLSDETPIAPPREREPHGSWPQRSRCGVYSWIGRRVVLRWEMAAVLAPPTATGSA